MKWGRCFLWRCLLIHCVMYYIFYICSVSLLLGRFFLDLIRYEYRQVGLDGGTPFILFPSNQYPPLLVVLRLEVRGVWRQRFTLVGSVLDAFVRYLVLRKKICVPFLQCLRGSRSTDARLRYPLVVPEENEKLGCGWTFLELFVFFVIPLLVRGRFDLNYSMGLWKKWLLTASRSKTSATQGQPAKRPYMTCVLATQMVNNQP